MEVLATSCTAAADRRRADAHTRTPGCGALDTLVEPAAPGVGAGSRALDAVAAHEQRLPQRARAYIGGNASVSA